MTDFFDQYRSGPPEYREIVDSWGHEVIAWTTFGEWQGDHGAIFRDGPRVGYVIIGYGSCSGCDVLQDIWSTPYEEDEVEIQKMLDQARRLSRAWDLAIRWFDSPEDLVFHLVQGKSDGTEWAFYEEDIFSWLMEESARLR